MTDDLGEWGPFEICNFIGSNLTKMNSVNAKVFCLLVVVMVSLVTACSPVEKEEEKMKDIESFHALLGRWADESRQNDFYEFWKESENGLTGTGVVMSQSDTVYIEHLEILKREGDWYYSAKIDRQNNGDPVYFKSEKVNDSLFVFENPEHDFPQKIVYDLQASGELLITISGFESDSLREEKFNMRKVN